MCGLIAGSGVLEARRLMSLGCLSESRGSDSAGVAWLEEGTVWSQKSVTSPLVAFPLHFTKSLRRAAKSGGPVIAHTRAATTGAVTERNAHPFYDQGIAFAHNGIISNYREFGNYEVDSECLIHGITGRDFSKFVGPIALVWIEEGKLHAFRKGNPLWRGIFRDGMYLASTKEMLSAIGCTRLRELCEGHHYTFKGRIVEKCEKLPFNTEKAIGRGAAIGVWESESYYQGRHYDQWDHVTRTWVPKVSEPQMLPAATGWEDDLSLVDAERDTLWCLDCQISRAMISSDAGLCFDCFKKQTTV